MPTNSDVSNPVFGAHAFWYVAIPKVVSLHPRSGELVDEFLRQKKAGQDDIVGINTEFYASRFRGDA